MKRADALYAVLLGASCLALLGCTVVREFRIENVSDCDPPPRPALAFDRTEIDLGDAGPLTVLTGFLLDRDVAEIAVVEPRGERAAPRLRIYDVHDAASVVETDVPLRPTVTFVDVIAIDGRDRLVTHEPGRLSWLELETGATHELVAVDCRFTPPHENEIPHVDVTHDVNGDGRDDLVVPGDTGFLVFVQEPDGSFADGVSIGAAPDLSRITGAQGYRYDPWSQSRVHAIDHDLDDRVDLVYWNRDRFAVHHQASSGRFAPTPATFAAGVAFDTDALDSLANSTGGGTVLQTLTDMNDDCIGDLVTYTLEAGPGSDTRSRYDVHLGRKGTDGGTEFSSVADRSFRTDRRVQLGFARHDFDDDGRLDVMITTIDTNALEGGAWKRIRGAMGDDVWLDVEFYRSRDGSFLHEPDAVRRVQLDGHPSTSEPGWVPLDVVLRGATHERRPPPAYRRAFNPMFRVGDVTGDGLADVLIEHTVRVLYVHAGVPCRELFAARPERVAIHLPLDEELTRLVDIDRDGRHELLMHRRSTDRGQRVTLLSLR